MLKLLPTPLVAIPMRPVQVLETCINPVRLEGYGNQLSYTNKSNGMPYACSGWTIWKNIRIVMSKLGPWFWPFGTYQSLRWKWGWTFGKKCSTSSCSCFHSRLRGSGSQVYPNSSGTKKIWWDSSKKGLDIKLVRRPIGHLPVQVIMRPSGVVICWRLGIFILEDCTYVSYMCS